MKMINFKQEACIKITLKKIYSFVQKYFSKETIGYNKKINNFKSCLGAQLSV